ncbi:long-chain fatty acid--CoA ligase [Lampropedia puyangensis]|uniref:Long-chain fatty acid--CoA ligase n=1 Tax=Lampropedia puyangensis TaxID=1330072 RepID=A0A4S8EZJ7_9BURK|nr:AMP-binding protein [Lampropedia puyangensis]THT98261.1 long-chain fatty acid--CoA ligase [Lampropedia puyangensis]
MTDFVALLEQHARCQPEKLALRTAQRDWSYHALADGGRRAASVLQAHGIGAGDRVALLCFNTAGFMLALLGAWRLGATVVPINHKLQGPEVQYILAHARVKLCVVDGALASIAAHNAQSCGWLSTDTAIDGMPDFDAECAAATAMQGDVVLDGQSVAEILYTSGTTGKPKGCLLSHSAVLQTAMSAAASTSLTRTDRTLIAMPIWHSSPLNNWSLGTLLMGGSLVFLREYSPQAFVQTLSDERITFTFGAPIAYLAPLAVVGDLSVYDFSAIRLWAYGGGPLGAEMVRKLAQSYRNDRFIQVYGMTETGPLGSVLYPEEAQSKAGSIGRIGTPGVVIEVRNTEGARCAAGEVGEIYLRSPGIMLGYLDDPQATAKAFDAQGWYASGDLARIDEEGYLFIVDRLKDMIVTGGENVYSKEVEDAIAGHPAVQDVAVVGRAHPEWGETVVAMLVLKPQQNLSDEELKAYLSPKLARYKIPRVFEWRDQLPRTVTGKLLKHVLRAS